MGIFGFVLDFFDSSSESYESQYFVYHNELRAYSIPAILVFVRSAMLLILFESNPFLEIRHDSHYSSKKTRLKRVEDPITHPNTDYKEMVRYTQNKKE